jgi:aminopeptidase-like protein
MNPRPETLSHLRSRLDLASAGEEMLALIRAFYPICRSISGDGLRQSLRSLADFIPVASHEVATGTQVFDWIVPKEWNIRDAYIKDSSGRRVIDFRKSNLHVVNYSAPVNARMTLGELRPRLHSLPEHPEWIPYRTSYYAESWGFCLSDRQLQGLTQDQYEVVIDSALEEGAITYGECVLPGQREEEFLISTHVCHPSLANDNLSGLAVAATLARLLGTLQRRYTYRFLFVPGTIGALAWLFRNQATVKRIKHGLVLACVGDRGELNYKRSRRQSADIDRAVEHVLKTKGTPFAVREFSPYGYDERQYCSPGFDLPVGSFRRTPHGEYPEYHTSADNLDLVSAPHLADSLATLLEVIDLLENDLHFVNLSPMGEPQLGRRGLVSPLGGKAASDDQLALLWLLNLSDGTNGVLDIAARSGLPYDAIRRAVDALMACGLLDRANAAAQGVNQISQCVSSEERE